MGLNTIGFAIDSKVNNLQEITDKLNIIIEGPIEENIFENAISNNIKEDEIFLTTLEKGTLVIVGTEFPFFGEDFSVLSKFHQKFTKFIHADTSSQYYFEHFENGEFIRSKYVSEGEIEINEGDSLPIEFAGLTDDDLVMNLINKTCGKDLFTIEPDTKSIKYRYISGKPISKIISHPIENHKHKTDSKPASKNRIIFFLVLIHIFLGISNTITAILFLNKSFESQISNYISLILFGIMGYFLFKRKSWMRLLFVVLYFVSLPISIISFKLNVLFLNNLTQLIIDTIIIVLLFNKDVIKLYKQQLITTENIFDKISIKEVLILLVSVIIFQIGAADIILQTDLLQRGFLTGIISGIFIALGIFLVRRTLKTNYHR